MPIDDTMEVAVDKTTTHRYTRSGKKVTLDMIQEGSCEKKARSYQSVHAAVCAFGRLRAEPTFRADWQASVDIQQIRATRGARQVKKARPFTAEVIALALMETGDIEEVLQDVMPSLRQKYRSGKPLLVGSACLRRVLARENNKIRQEEKEA